MTAPRRYAQHTKVSVEQSQAQARAMVRALGADRSAIMESSDGALVWFEIRGRQYMLSAPPPPPDEGNVHQRQKSDWRALVLLLKAKKVAIEQGVTTVEREFFADVMMPKGARLIDYSDTLIEAAYREGGPPKLILK